MTSIKPRSAAVIIYQGDDMERLAELRQEADYALRQQEAAKKSPGRVGDDTSDEAAREAQAAFNAFVDEAAERAVTVEVRALGRRAFRDLMAEHEPRKVDGPDGPEDHADDGWFGVNMLTFPDALLTYRDGAVRTILKPEFPTTAACQRFLDEELSDGQYDEVFHAAYGLNRSASADPKASRFSVEPPTSTETSSSPDRLG